MDEVKILIELVQGGGFVGLLIVLAFPPLRKKIFGLNGEHNTEMLTNIKDNHLHTIQEGIDRLMEGQHSLSRDIGSINNTLSVFKEYGIKIRKE